MDKMSEKEKAIECLRNLARVEGVLASHDIECEEFAYSSLDFVVKYFEDLIKELEQ